jgi:hypothetical protein
VLWVAYGNKVKMVYGYFISCLHKHTQIVSHKC